MKYDLGIIKFVYDSWLGLLNHKHKVGDVIGLGHIYGREQNQQLCELFWAAGYKVSFPHNEEQFVVKIDGKNDVDYYDEYWNMIGPDHKVDKDKFPDHIFCDKRRSYEDALSCVQNVIAPAINAKLREFDHV